MNIVTNVMALAVLAAIFVVKDRWADRRSRRHVAAWARVRGLRIVSIRRDWWRGYPGIPSAWLVITRQRVYEVTVVDDTTSRQRRARLWTGGYALGSLRSLVKEEWLDERPPGSDENRRSKSPLARHETGPFYLHRQDG